MRRCAQAVVAQGLEQWNGGSSPLAYMKFRVTEVGCHLAPHVDASKRDVLNGDRSSTHTFILYLSSCISGGETLLLDRLAPSHDCSGDAGMADAGVNEAGLGVRAAVKPLRGRLMLFPHVCPH